jgi:hypothetical protein
MKRILFGAMATLLSFLFLGCANMTVSADSPANAYIGMIDDLYEASGYADDGLTRLAFDFSALDADLKEIVSTLAKEFCRERGLSYLEGTMEELVGRGYITTSDAVAGETMPSSFPDGALFRFDIQSQTETEVVCDASLWRANLSARGFTYSAVFSDGAWSLSTSNFWMS